MANTEGSDRKLQNRAVLGITLMIIGLALYPLSDAFIKKFMEIYSVQQATFLRAFTRLIPLLIAVLFQGGFRKVFGTAKIQNHFVRLGVNFFYTMCFMYAFSKGALTPIYTLSYTSPLFMIILSAIMLKEAVSVHRWIAVGIGLLGVVVAIRPGSSVFEMISIVVLLGTFLGALNKILMRRLASTEHSLAIAVYPNVVMILAMAPFLITSWQTVSWEHWRLLAIVGVITAAGQYCIAQALRFAQGSMLATVDYSTYFWVICLDFLWWNRTPDIWNVLGAAIIVGSNFYILYRTKKEQAIKTAPNPIT